MKKFTLYNYGKRIELEILEKITDNSVKVNVVVDKNEVAKNETAHICQVSSKPGKLFLRLKTDENDMYITICDKSRGGDPEHNRRVADWIWENIQGKQVLGSVSGFTTHHWRNWEGH